MMRATTFVRSWISLGVIVAASVVLAPSLHASEPIERGMTGDIEFEWSGDLLVADPRQTLDAPIVLRLERQADTDTYLARFIGSVAGEYDLRTLIEFADGRSADDLPPIPVTIVSDLPGGRGSDLFAGTDVGPSLQASYRTWIIAALIAWLAVPALMIWWRLRSAAPPPEVIPEPPVPTAVEQLLPLLEVARSRPLAVEEKSRFDMLLYSVWRTRFGDIEPEGLVDAVRRDPSSSQLLDAVEAWLHAPNGSSDDAATTLDRAEALVSA